MSYLSERERERALSCLRERERERERALLELLERERERESFIRSNCPLS